MSHDRRSLLGLAVAGLSLCAGGLHGQTGEAEPPPSLLEGLSREIRAASEHALRGLVTVEVVPSFASERSWLDAGLLLDAQERLIVTTFRPGFRGDETAYVRFFEPDAPCYRATVVGSLPHLQTTVLHVDRLEGARELPAVQVVERPVQRGSLVVGLHVRRPALVATTLGLLSEVLPPDEEHAAPRWSFQLPRITHGEVGVTVDARGHWLAWLIDAPSTGGFFDVFVDADDEAGGAGARLRRVEIEGTGRTVIQERGASPRRPIQVETPWPLALTTSAARREGVPLHLVRKEARRLLGQRVEQGFSLRGARHPWLGVMVAPEEDGAVEGLRVLDLFEGSPARRAGLERGDLIRRADGSPVRTGADLVKIIGRVSQDGGHLRIEVVRREQTLEVSAALSGGDASAPNPKDTPRREDGKR